MQTTRRFDDNTVHIALTGELGLESVGQFHAEVVSALSDHRPARLVVDLARLTLCDSVGIGALVTARNTALARGTAFQVSNPSGIVHRTLLVTGLLDVLTTG